ncbi:MAG: mucoidy inhibitor MuiA family protein [Bacteroidales bacterium]|nr:mucoidy inhibitor MuiA family protein [Bacteroidales bacterium]
MKILTVFGMLYTGILLNAQIKELPIKTEASEVTIFINGAQVVREKIIDIPQGISILKFTELSPYLEPKSIQVKINGEIMILSVNHQFNYLDSVRFSQEIENLRNKLKELDKTIMLERVNLETLDEELNFLKDNRVIGGKNQELNLNNFKQTTDFYKERIAAAKKKQVEVNSNLEKLNEEKVKIEKQINQMITNKPTPVSEVIVKVNSTTPTRCEAKLVYYVKNAGWFPTYDIRSKSISDPIEIVYKANVRQNTKEDWKNVRLKLSSTDPNLGNIAPKLLPYYLDFNTLPPQYNNNMTNQVSGRVLDATNNEPLIGATIVVKGTTIGTVADVNGFYSISIPNQNSELTASYIGYQSQTILANTPNINFYLQPEAKMLDEVVVQAYDYQPQSASFAVKKLPKLASGDRESLNISLPVTKTENQTAFEFEINTPYTINSDNKSTLVDIGTYLVDANYEYYCVPKIDKDAFLVAHLVNWEKYNLLEGEASIYFENTFVGKSILDVRFLSDTLTISLGRDKNIIVKRDKIREYTKKQFFGTKKEETRAWLISIKNNKKQTIKLNLFDQIPVSTNQEIEVLPEELSGGILQRETGEVKWNIILPPAEKKEVQLRYRVIYPKQRNLIIE